MREVSLVLIFVVLSLICIKLCHIENTLKVKIETENLVNELNQRQIIIERDVRTCLMMSGNYLRQADSTVIFINRLYNQKFRPRNKRRKR